MTRDEIKQNFINQCEFEIKKGNGDKTMFGMGKSYRQVLEEVKKDTKRPDGSMNIIDMNVCFQKILKGEMTMNEAKEQGFKLMNILDIKKE